MRFLHTSDWHIGKKLEGRDRLEEQRAVLDEIVSVAERENVDVVLVAGDVFDTYLPSAEAEDLFYDTVMKLSARKRLVVVISGNHDDAMRLCAAVPLAEKLGIVLAGNINAEIHTGIATENARVLSAGAGWLTCESRDKERAFLSLIPYPTENRYKENAVEGETFSDKMKRWLHAGVAYNAERLPVVMVGHFFTVGGEVSDSEREIDLGGARAVTRSIMPDCAYIALGHLHKKQVMNKTGTIRYSGAILQYSFDECSVEKAVVVFDLSGGKIENLREIPLQSGVRLKRISACDLADAEEQLEKARDYYVELPLTLSRPLAFSENKHLRTLFPNLLKLNLELTEDRSARELSRKNLSDREMFVEYYKTKYGKEPEEELLSLYLEIMEELNQ